MLIFFLLNWVPEASSVFLHLQTALHCTAEMKGVLWDPDKSRSHSPTFTRTLLFWTWHGCPTWNRADSCAAKWGALAELILLSHFTSLFYSLQGLHSLHSTARRLWVIVQLGSTPSYRATRKDVAKEMEGNQATADLMAWSAWLCLAAA